MSGKSARTVAAAALLEAAQTMPIAVSVGDVLSVMPTCHKKGCGCGGATGSPDLVVAAVANAFRDALTLRALGIDPMLDLDDPDDRQMLVDIHTAALSIQDGPDPENDYRGSPFHWAVAGLLMVIASDTRSQVMSAWKVRAAAKAVAESWRRPW